MKKTAILLVATSMTSTAAYASEWGSRSLRLSDDMTEQQAINAVGYSLSSVDLGTCGQQVPAPDMADYELGAVS